MVPEQHALKSPDAHNVVNASAANLTAVEQTRTNASDGSLRDRRRRIEEQEESIQIEGFGTKADRQTRLTEKDLIKAEAAAKPNNQSSIDSARSSDPQDSRPIIERPPEQLDKRSYALAVEYQEGRTPSQALTDFSKSAIGRLTDQEGQRAYFQGQIDKVCGIYAGLDIAKEDTKKGAVVAWTALTDGTVANFLSHKDAINEPLFRTIGSTLDVMARDPLAVDHALNQLGSEIIKANDWYNSLSPHEQGKEIGKAMFALANPEGSTEAGQAALKMADQVATHVDKAVVDQFTQITEQISAWSVTAPEKALQGKQYLYELSKSLKLTGPELEYVGIPKGYFSELRGTEVSEKLIEGKADDHILRMSPWYEKGSSHPISANRAAELAGVDKAELSEITEDRLREKGLSYLPKPYRELYLEAHPQYNDYPGGLEVHHRIAQTVLKQFPDLFSAEEIHGLENLRGIPRASKVHSIFTREWNAFLRDKTLTRQQIVDFAKVMDGRYGSCFLP